MPEVKGEGGGRGRDGEAELNMLQLKIWSRTTFNPLPCSMTTAAIKTGLTPDTAIVVATVIIFYCVQISFDVLQMDII